MNKEYLTAAELDHYLKTGECNRRRWTEHLINGTWQPDTTTPLQPGFDWPVHHDHEHPDLDPNTPVAKEAGVIVKGMLAAEERGDVVWDDRSSTWQLPPTKHRYQPPGRTRTQPITQTALLAKLKKVRPTHTGFTARCPAHHDNNPSLSIRRGRKWWLFHCFAGCASVDIVAALNLDWGDLALDE